MWRRRSALGLDLELYVGLKTLEDLDYEALHLEMTLDACTTHGDLLYLEVTFDWCLGGFVTLGGWWLGGFATFGGDSCWLIFWRLCYTWMWLLEAYSTFGGWCLDVALGLGGWLWRLDIWLGLHLELDLERLCLHALTMLERLLWQG